MKIVLSNHPSSTAMDGFGTRIVNVNNSTPQLRQVLLDQVTELVNGFVEGRYAVQNMSNDEFVFADLERRAGRLYAERRGERVSIQLSARVPARLVSR